MKILIIGTNHAGIAAANTLLENYPEHEIVMLERNSNLSYLGCGTALWVGRQIDDYKGLFYTNEEAFAKKGARIYTETEVTEIDFKSKKVYAQKKDGEKIEESYDKLILATGSLPISPKFPGYDLEGLHFLKLFQEGQIVDKALSDESAKNVCVIGAGYIGVEIAEAAKRRGKNVRIFDAEATSLASYYDPEFAKMMDRNLEDHGIKTHFGELVQEYIGENGKVKAVKTDNGTYDADVVINSIGFRANTDLGKDHLELFNGGAYLVDRHFKTSDEDVYAIGDCASNYSNAIKDTTYIALASNAVRSGIVAAHNLAGTELEGAGVQGSNGINIFNLKLVSTGLTLKAAEKAGIEVDYVEHEDTQFPGFMPENYQVKLRIVFEKSSRRIVGAQLASDYDVSLLIHMFSLAIQEEVTIDKLALLDTFFLPHFNQPYNYITVAALKAKK
ncbi:H2O-forming NADH oxidase [Facklamia miroungae]|uniref:NADH oxidase n=1 Tax=Facklamia miroungae TaxID=120956 RepID=A0A1G7RPQ2_9LACT|nr:FAD-dependent oxidoreductase [Facklamia miroungae]NKZ29347.1 FAD-dependent oxidoreductase [Facklamia miroungae]SDG12169.1 NADPH-dependent 2,4-dienoyl-CoA reductase, sulfur reductase [Facklamia miroungae]